MATEGVNTTQPLGHVSADDWFAQNHPGGAAGPGDAQASLYGATAEDVQKAAEQLLGHRLTDPSPWVGQKDFYQNLASSPEAQNYAKAHPATTSGGGASTSGAGPSGGGNSADLLNQLKTAVRNKDPKAQDLFNQYFASRGAKPEDWSYWGPKLEQDPDYFASRLEKADAFGGGGGGVPGTPGNQQFSYPTWDEKFQAPTGVSEQNDPGFQARLQMGTDALQRSAAARGSVLDTGTLKDLNKYAQDYATNEYANVYNRQAGEYNQRYQQYLQGYQNALTSFGTNFGVDQSLWNRAFNEQGQGFQQQYNLASLGYGATGGTAGAGNAYGNQAGTDYTGMGNAAAAGTVGSGNAYGSMFGNLANIGGTAAYRYFNKPPGDVTY